MLQGEGGQQREADDDTQGHDGQRCQVATGRPAIPEQQQQCQAQDTCNGGAGHREEYRIEGLYGHAGGG